MLKIIPTFFVLFIHYYEYLKNCFVKFKSWGLLYLQKAVTYIDQCCPICETLMYFECSHCHVKKVKKKQVKLILMMYFIKPIYPKLSSQYIINTKLLMKYFTSFYSYLFNEVLLICLYKPHFKDIMNMNGQELLYKHSYREHSNIGKCQQILGIVHESFNTWVSQHG